MDKPIRIYLDTSDYARLYKEDITAQDKQVLDFLLENVEKSRIEIGYSYWNVIELIQDGDPHYLHDRRRRGGIIKRLCGLNAFPHPADAHKGAQFPNGGVWFPKGPLNKLRVEVLIDTLLAGVSSIKNATRAQRRRLSTLSGLRDFALAGHQIFPTKRADYKGFPISDDFIESDYLNKYIRGKISAEHANRKLISWISDPELFFEIWYEYAGMENPFLPLVKSASKLVESKIHELIEKRRTLSEIHATALDAYRKLESAAAGNKEFIAAIRKLRPKKIEMTKIAPQLNSRLGGDRWGHVDWYLEKVSKGEVAFAESDFGDLMHLQYVQDCDLLRCDKKMASIFRDCASFEARRLVGSLGDLPDRVAEISR